MATEMDSKFVYSRINDPHKPKRVYKWELGRQSISCKQNICQTIWNLDITREDAQDGKLSSVESDTEGILNQREHL